MALRVARGLFRLWLVLSVLWIGGVGVVTWWTLPSTPEPILWGAKPVPENPPPPGFVIDPKPFDPDEFLAKAHREERRAVIAAIRFASVLALVPPVLLLALG